MFKKSLLAIVTATALFGFNTNSFAFFDPSSEPNLSCDNDGNVIYNGSVYNSPSLYCADGVVVYDESNEPVRTLDKAMEKALEQENSIGGMRLRLEQLYKPLEHLR